MNKLGSKEIFLILIIVNFLLYYLAYMCVISPLRTKGEEYQAEITTLETRYNEEKSIVDSKDQYIATIETLKSQKQTLFTNSFPDAETESLHAYMVERAQASNIVINSISLSQDISTVINEQTKEETPTGLRTNTINVNVVGSYANIINLITDIESVKKTSLLTGLGLSGDPTNMSTTINYELLTVDKGDEIDDPIFDHTFNQGLTNEALFKN